MYLVYIDFGHIPPFFSGPSGWIRSVQRIFRTTSRRQEANIIIIFVCCHIPVGRTRLSSSDEKRIGNFTDFVPFAVVVTAGVAHQYIRTFDISSTITIMTSDILYRKLLINRLGEIELQIMRLLARRSRTQEE